jgi:hypothetical protein
MASSFQAMKAGWDLQPHPSLYWVIPLKDAGVSTVRDFKKLTVLLRYRMVKTVFARSKKR